MVGQCRGILNNSAVFLTWTVTSFLCHYYAKVYLHTSSTASSPQTTTEQLWSHAFSVTFLTFAQTALCYVLVSASYSGEQSGTKTVKVTHCLATFATNLSLSVMFASSTLAIKLAEPVTTTAIQYVVQGTAVSGLAAASLPIIVGGAVAFAGNPLSNTHLSLGVGAAFSSNILLAFRNLAIKKMESGDQSSLTLRLQRSKLLLVMLLITAGSMAVGYSQGYEVLSVHTMETLAACFLSAVFHVVYSYVSTGLMLSQLSVVTHSVVNIMKRVVVVLLLYVSGRREASLYNGLGLVACTLGLTIYTIDKQRKHLGGGFYLKLIWAVLLGLLCLVAALMGRHLVGHVSPPTPQLHENMQPDPIIDQTFGGHSFKRPELAHLLPSLDGYLRNWSADLEAFLASKLITDPVRVGYLSGKLQTSLEVIKETQRIHYNMFEDAIGQFKLCMLLDIADFENKGDPAITVGEIYFLSRFKLEVIYYCSSNECTDQQLQAASVKARTHSREELVILIHGGGSIVGYAERDQVKFKILHYFSGFQLFVFPQSIWAPNMTTKHFELCRERYCCNENLTIVLRDLTSYSIAKKYFNGTSRLLMAPDMAFHIGPVKRIMSPVFDILWIKRVDQETLEYTVKPRYPSHLRVHVTDWHKFLTPTAGSSLERAFYAATMGLLFTQRGRVVVTDRLHGHIFATLLNIPHVLIDNRAHKLANYHNTWTRGLENTRLAGSPEEALKYALELLQIYDHALPPRVALLIPNLKNDNWNLADSSYP